MGSFMTVPITPKTSSLEYTWFSTPLSFTSIHGIMNSRTCSDNNGPNILEIHTFLNMTFLIDALDRFNV